MRMNQLKRHGIELRPGTLIKGKWHNKRYVIKRKLGEGTVGSVYLCATNGKDVALKISHQDASITIEVSVLKALQQVQGNHLGPALLDVDDFVADNQRTYSFYVMEYLDGESLTSFFSKRGKEWIGVLMLQLLDDLEKLHQMGWVFGDLKADNLIILSSPTRIRFIDVGGTTQRGRAIKEYTEFYDRGYWGIGTRRAEPSYDLFAFAMVFISIFYPKHFAKTAKPQQTIFQKIDAIDALKPYRRYLKKAITGKYNSSAELKDELLRAIQTRSSSKGSLQVMETDKMLPFLINSGGIGLLAGVYYLLSVIISP